MSILKNDHPFIRERAVLDACLACGNMAYFALCNISAKGIPHTVIADNAAGLLIQRGQVDMCIVGADRVTRNGDTCNKVGTYLKALACQAHNVPFYVALPYTTFDPKIETGGQIVIENRTGDEVAFIQGKTSGDDVQQIRVIPQSSPALNPAFDVTPFHFVTGYVTEKGISNPERFDQTPGSLRPIHKRHFIEWRWM